MATIAADDEQAIDRGAFRILLKGVLGPSGAELLGRFCHADPGLEKMVPQHLAAEEALAPDAVFAEIAEVIAPVMSIAGEYRQLQSATGAFERVHELLAERRSPMLQTRPRSHPFSMASPSKT